MDFSNLINLQGMLFLLVAVGLILRKVNVLPKQGTAILTDIVIYLVLPCNIINSFFIEFNLEVLKNFIIILLISCFIQFGCLILSNTLYNRQTSGFKKVLQYGTVCSNAGFMGNPIAEGVFGTNGLLLASIYLIPQRIVMWSAGVSYFTESPDRKTIVKKVVTHPCIVAVYIGLLIMIFQIPLPVFIENTIKNISSCTTSLSMILIGTILAEVNIKTIVNRTAIYYAFIRLILIPLLVFAACKILEINDLLTGVSVLLAGMPAGSTTAILAAKYDGDSIFATKCVVFTTLLSMITIPLWCLIL
ncbi:AEC family transporter [Anaerocolumna sp. MB42-C2]|uniref:AEC family transporter n=1 Tax=Anaerocolumna sp. MB42-C2 TaxID=3070997 RepID=UPI0027E078DF|nr:AEC family transporter [Anaerocolumna sp. MB42-C2]WMJ88976.1 AEC family transporter [Anaerocolumna sp. MB42-C2]